MYLTHYLLAALLTVAVSARPHRHGNTFTVEQVQVSRHGVRGDFKRSGARALLHAYRKHHIPISPQLETAAANGSAGPATRGSVLANPQASESLYTSPVTVGGQTLNLHLDTGSSDLWVYSTLLPASDQANHSVYDPSKSPTSKLISGYTWNITYEDKTNAAGVVYNDNFTIGGLTAPSQAVEVATTIRTDVPPSDDGILGLSFGVQNTVKPTPQRPFFDNIKDSLTAPLFTATLKRGAPGSYDFGFIDHSKYTGSITWVDVSMPGRWAFNASGYAVGTGAGTNSTNRPLNNLLVDTGTSIILLPGYVVREYYKQVNGSVKDPDAGGYIFPCSSALPNFTVVIAGANFVVPGSYISLPASEDGVTCFGGIQDGVGVKVLGDVFLKAHFVVFESAGDEPRVGFAKQRDAPSS